MSGTFTHRCTAHRIADLLTADVTNGITRLADDGLEDDQALDLDQAAEFGIAPRLKDLNQGHSRWGSAGDSPSADGRQGG
jgi:hypothetical protein